MEWGIAAVVAVVIGFYAWYATLIRRRNKVREALGLIDVQLLKRHDLIPNVLKLAEKFMSHERDLMTGLTELRTKAEAPYEKDDPDQVKGHLDAAGALQGLFGRFFAVAEEYPDLRSSDTIVTAQHTYSEVEGHIAAARRFYNSAVNDLNNAVEIFPGTLIAGVARVRSMPFFEVEDEAARAPARVEDHLK
jgi:LemA protein